MNDLKLLKGSDNYPDKKDWDDLEWINEFYDFLLGNLPQEISMPKTHQPKMSQKKAGAIIWYLQEHMPVLPDKIDQCDFCKTLYNSHNSGWYSDKKMKHYCDSCDTYIQDGHQKEQ